MSETWLGLLQSLSWVGAVLGCFIYFRWMRQMPLRKSLSISISLDILSTFLCLLMFNRFSVISLSFVAGIMAYVTLLPLMSTAARLAHGTGFEGSLFAIYMSIRNGGVVLATYVGGYVHHWLGLRLLILISALCSAAGFFLLRRLKTVSP